MSTVNSLVSSFESAMNSLAVVAKSMKHLEDSLENVSIQAHVEQSHVAGIIVGMPAIAPEAVNNPLAKQLGLDVAVENLGLARSMLTNHRDCLGTLSVIAMNQAEQVKQLSASFSTIATPEANWKRAANLPTIQEETPTVPQEEAQAEVSTEAVELIEGAPLPSQEQESALQPTGPFPLEVSGVIKAGGEDFPVTMEGMQVKVSLGEMATAEEVATSAANPAVEMAPPATLFPVADAHPEELHGQGEPEGAIRFSDLNVGDAFEFSNPQEWWKQGACRKSGAGKFIQDGKTVENRSGARSAVRRLVS